MSAAYAKMGVIALDPIVDRPMTQAEGHALAVRVARDLRRAGFSAPTFMAAVGEQTDFVHFLEVYLDGTLIGRLHNRLDYDALLEAGRAWLNDSARA